MTPRPVAVSDRRPWRDAIVVSVGLLALGQLILLVLGPLTRAARAGEGTAGPFGIALLSSDSRYYLRGSETLLPDVPLNRIVYPAILRLGTELGAAELFAVLVNLLALATAGALLYDLGRRYGGDRLSGGLAAAAMLVNPLTAQWMRFLLTETLMYSAVIVVLWSAERSGRDPRRRTVALLLAAGLFAALLRPNGVMLLASSASILVLARGWRSRDRWKAAVACLAIVSAALGLLFFGARAGDARAPSASGVVISLLYDGVVIEGSEHALVRTSMPAPSDPRDTSLGAAVEYALDHPLAVARLGALRVAHETWQVRRHYPTVVNIAIGLGFCVLLALSAAGRRSRRDRSLDLPFVLVAIPQIVLIAATFAVPEARYGWTYLVGLSVWAGAGGAQVLRSAARIGPVSER